VTEKELIEGCQREDRLAQKAFYERFSPAMFGVCRRYISNREDCEDVLVKAMYKALANIDQFKGQGSLEGWLRRIVVNEALMFLRLRRLKFDDELDERELPSRPRAVDQLVAQDILDLLDALPTGYRTVFNLYVLEGYKHREIADLLGISINTSKSQLIFAKKRLQELLEKINYPGVRSSTQ
jgi:RNA polymerase sigma factor (sigma-70 family)